MAYNDYDFEFDDIDLEERRRRRVSEGKKRRRRKKKRRRILGAILPPLIAIVLIAVVAMVAVKEGLFESFSYSTKEADLFSYYGVNGTDTAIVMVDGEPTEGRIRVVNGTLYIPLSDVKSIYTDRFYYEVTENKLLYTTEQQTVWTEPGTSSYTGAAGTVNTPYMPVFAEKDGETEQLFMALDYLRLFVNMSVNLQGGETEPYRVEVKTVWNTVQTAAVTKAHKLRTGEDKKSDILAELSEGETVTVLEQLGEWTKVTTERLITGYAETRYLGSVSETPEQPVTDVAPEQFTSLTADTPVVMMWHAISGVAGNDTFYSATEGIKAVNVLSPTWFSVAAEDGSVRHYASHDYVNAAHAKGMQVWAAVDDFNENRSFSDYDLFTYPQRRQLLIDSLISLAKEYGIDGINVDFERVTADSGEAFIQFIRELSIACHQNGLVVSVDNYVPKAYNSFYHRREQGIFADYVVIMGYDETTVASDRAGSVASISFVQEGIVETLKDVPNNKVINALPFYTRVWEETPKTDQEIADSAGDTEFVPYELDILATPSMKQEDELLSNYHATPVWDATAMQNYATWTAGGKTYEVWLEDSLSLQAKLEFMNALDLGGVAGWEITLAAPYVWDLLDNYY